MLEIKSKFRPARKSVLNTVFFSENGISTKKQFKFKLTVPGIEGPQQIFNMTVPSNFTGTKAFLKVYSTFKYNPQDNDRSILSGASSLDFIASRVFLGIKEKLQLEKNYLTKITLRASGDFKEVKYVLGTLYFSPFSKSGSDTV